MPHNARRENAPISARFEDRPAGIADGFVRLAFEIWSWAMAVLVTFLGIWWLYQLSRQVRMPAPEARLHLFGCRVNARGSGITTVLCGAIREVERPHRDEWYLPGVRSSPAATRLVLNPYPNPNPNPGLLRSISPEIPTSSHSP